MKRFARWVLESIDLARSSNPSTALKVILLGWMGWDKPVKVLLNDEVILLRLKSPDLSVAIASLGSEFSVLSRILPHNFDGLIIDAGGYIGTAAIKFSKMYPMAKVITIEPSKDNFKLLLENTRNFKNISTLNAALVASNRTGVTLLNRGTGAWGYTVIEKPLDNPSAEAIQNVETVTISDIIKAHNNAEVGILKLDIEGSEKEIFVQNDTHLSNTLFIFVELHDRIVDGCSQSFHNFSRDRLILNLGGEKFLSVKKI